MNKWIDSTDRDMVNHPAHYTQGKIECIDCIEAAMTEEGYKGYLKGNAIKYLHRAGKKDSELQDYRKAEWYVMRLVALAREAETGE